MESTLIDYVQVLSNAESFARFKLNIFILFPWLPIAGWFIFHSAKCTPRRGELQESQF